jgi:hypothetical protein
MIDIRAFTGEMPRLQPRYLPAGAAQVARNCRLERGSLEPYRAANPVFSTPSVPVSIYRFNGAWLTFDVLTDVVRAPIAEDRIYYTQDGAGAFVRLAGGTVYALALPAPVSAPTVSMGGALDARLAQAVQYVYTYVTSLGEESPPSALSAAVEWSPGRVATVGGFAATPASRSIVARRIYRTQTSQQGITALFFVTEIPVATTSFAHDIATTPLGEVIDSTDYDPPPANLRGLRAMANGIMVGFDGKTVCFSEPYIPHAWPIRYRRNVDSPIVGLAAFGQSVAVLTEERPYIVQGSTPDTMVQTKIEDGLPCLSRAGIANMGYAAAYPTHRGLAVISPSGVQVVSEPLFTMDQWEALRPADFFAHHHNGLYIFGYPAADIETISGGAHDATFTGLDLYDGGDPSEPSPLAAVLDGGSPSRASETSALAAIDFRNPQRPFFTRLDGAIAALPSALWQDERDGRLYIASLQNEILEFDARLSGPALYVWRSGPLIFTAPVNFAGMQVEVSGDPVTSPVSVTIIADGVERHTATRANVPVRLPSGFLARTWEVEITGTATLTRFILAQSFDQLGMTG